MNDPYKLILKELQSAVDIPIEIESDGCYPDVMFNIFFTNIPDDAMGTVVGDALELFMLKYNKLHFLKPIHYVANTPHYSDDTSSFSFYFHMDCGNAHPKTALIGSLKAITNTNLPISRIIIEC